MNPNYFNPNGFFDPRGSNFMNNVFSTVGNSLNSVYPYLQPNQGGYYMEQEPTNSYNFSNQRPNTNIRVNSNYSEPFDTEGFYRNFENFPQIFQSDNFFSGRRTSQGRRNRQPQQSDYPQDYQNPQSSIYQQYQSGRPEEENKDRSQKNKSKEPKSAKKSEILEAEKNPKSGHYWKKLGNEEYRKGRYDQAIQNYTKAIEINDTESVFFSNRARCFKVLKNYKKAYEDAVHAIELDETNIKAHLICGQMIAEMAKKETGTEKLNVALNRLTKALTLCAGQGKQDFEKDLYRNMLRVRKLMWYKKNEEIQAQKLEMLAALKMGLEVNKNISLEEKEKKYRQYIEVIGDPTKPHEYIIPDFLCCKITLDLMEEPVTTSSGHSYDKEPLMAHLERNGYSDPVTREPIKRDVIVPNLNIKQAIEEFVKQ